jgi:hypothetical protein
VATGRASYHVDLTILLWPYEPGGRDFESLRARHLLPSTQCITRRPANPRSVFAARQSLAGPTGWNRAECPGTHACAPRLKSLGPGFSVWPLPLGKWTWFLGCLRFRVYTAKMPIAPADLLNDRVLPFCGAVGVRVQAKRKDSGREDCVSAGQPSSNGSVERMYPGLPSQYAVSPAEPARTSAPRKSSASWTPRYGLARVGFSNAGRRARGGQPWAWPG